MARRLLQILALGFVANAAWGQTETEQNAVNPAQHPPTVFSRINGLFGGDLPQLDVPDAIKLILRPHFGDLVRRDYMRVETGLRWALNDHFELNSEASAFFTHGLGDSAGYGIGKVRFGSKYVFENWPEPDYETSVGLNIDLPTGRPPLDMTDGHNHVSPSFVVQHHSYDQPRLTTFAGMGLDLMSNSRVPGTFGSNQPHDNSMSFTAGGVYDLGQLKWTLTASYTTTSLVSSHPEQFFTFQPGILWYVPRKFTLHSKTQWILALGAGTTWGPDGTDFSLTSRLRAEITFRQVMQKIRSTGTW